MDLLKVSKQTNYKKYFEENRKTVKLSGTTLIKLYIQSMVISTNRPGHRETDLSDLGSTFKKKISAIFKHPHYLLPGIQLGQSKIVPRDKLLNGN